MSDRTVSRVALSVDVVGLAIRDDTLKVLLIQRDQEPFAGSWALPGGVVGPEETLDDAARRVLVERTGVQDSYLEQLYTWGDPERDPRGRTIAVSYYTLLPLDASEARSGSGVRATEWFEVAALPELAFDHARIVEYATRRLREKIEYTPLAFHVLPERFTMSELRHLYEVINRETYPASNFEKMMRARWNLLRMDEVDDSRRGRPARKYRYVGPRRIAGPPESEVP
ncbi:MAG TPA: NUDIX domain-containing protein [Chloroflexota bacterium]|nr:NUDIX domain-containing protein [Chloroflexota bacterium]